MQTTKLAILMMFIPTLIFGCSKRPTALDACAKIEIAGLAKNCHETKPSGLGAAASQRVEFDLPSVPGKGASVFQFADEKAYDATEDGYTKAAMLAGPHRYGNRKALIFVQANEGLSLDDGKKLKVVVDGL